MALTETVGATIQPDSVVNLNVDNQSVRWYVLKQGGTRSDTLNRLALRFWDIVQERRLLIHCNYVRTAENPADIESRKFLDRWDFQLDKDLFTEMCQSLEFSVNRDLFASRNCHQVRRFVTKLPTAGAEATDALSVKWSDNDYLFPPVPLIGKCLQKIVLDKCRVLLVCPAWGTNMYWTHVQRLMVQRPFVLPHVRECLRDPATGQPPTLKLNPLRGFLLDGRNC